MIIKLPVFNNGTRAGHEQLVVEDIGHDRYRLVHSPGFVEGLAAGDEFQLSDAHEQGYIVLHRSGTLCVWFFFPQTVDEQMPQVQALRKQVEAVGGYLDGGFRSLVIFNIPVSVGFTTTEALFDHAVEQHEGAEWLYSNVYDYQDGETLLNWW